MKYLITALAFSAALPLALTSCGKTSVASEKSAPAAAESADSFLAAYRKAHEAKDKTAPGAFLYNDGTPAEIVEFFKMMRDASLEGKGTVELKTPSAEDAAKFNQAMETPDGKYYKLPLTPSHQLVITVETKHGESTSKSSSSLPVGQMNGKFVIPLPVPTGQAAVQ
jgi:hypothetical protein